MNAIIHTQFGWAADQSDYEPATVDTGAAHAATEEHFRDEALDILEQVERLQRRYMTHLLDEHHLDEPSDPLTGAIGDLVDFCGGIEAVLRARPYPRKWQARELQERRDVARVQTETIRDLHHIVRVVRLGGDPKLTDAEYNRCEAFLAVAKVEG